MTRYFPCLAAMAMLAFSPLHADEAGAEGAPDVDAKSLLVNGDFTTDGGDAALPAGWPAANATLSYPVEEGNRFLRLQVGEPEKMVMLYREIALPADTAALELTYRVRYTDIQPGKKPWFDGRIMMNFKGADGKKIASGPAPNFRGTKADWDARSVSFLVPEGATKLEFMPAIFQAKAGVLEFDDIRIVATDPAPIIAAREEAARKKAAETARRAALVKPQVAVADPANYPPMLKVVGNELQSPDGKAVWLQGVAIASLEWSAGGDNILQSTRVAIEDWNVNCIRLGIREHFWDGTGPWQADGGAGYRQLVDDVVNYCADRGVYVVIDLHRFRAPEQRHADFWTKIATLYKDHPAVIFELFNEPHDISWKVWRDGGFVSTEKKADTDAVAENNETLRGFESVGMQALVDAVRDTGATNIVVAGGLDWAYDLSGILDGYALDDRNGNGVVYASHIYTWKSKWQESFLDVAAKYPLLVSECGATLEPMSFIPPERHEDPYVWVPDFLGMIQKHKLNWTAWCFHNRSSPCIIEDWDYTPTPYWGAFVKDALAGKQFEMKRMR